MHTAPFIEIGDVVLYRYLNAPDTIKFATISQNKSDPANGFIHVMSPFASQLLGHTEDQTVTCSLPAGNRELHIFAIKKALWNVKGSLGISAVNQ